MPDLRVEGVEGGELVLDLFPGVHGVEEKALVEPQGDHQGRLVLRLDLVAELGGNVQASLFIQCVVKDPAEHCPLVPFAQSPGALAKGDAAPNPYKLKGSWDLTHFKPPFSTSRHYWDEMGPRQAIFP